MQLCMRRPEELRREVQSLGHRRRNREHIASYRSGMSPTILSASIQSTLRSWERKIRERRVRRDNSGDTWFPRRGRVPESPPLSHSLITMQHEMVYNSSWYSFEDQVIRSVSLEESEANSMKTISLDSSTIVDEMSKITSLDTSPFNFDSTSRVLLKSGQGVKRIHYP